MHIFKSIHNGGKTLEDIEKEQEKFRENLGYIRQGNPRNRSQNHKIQCLELKIFLTQDGMLLKCLIIMLGKFLEVFMI